MIRLTSLAILALVATSGATTAQVMQPGCTGDECGTNANSMGGRSGAANNNTRMNAPHGRTTGSSGGASSSGGAGAGAAGGAGAGGAGAGAGGGAGGAGGR